MVTGDWELAVAMENLVVSVVSSGIDAFEVAMGDEGEFVDCVVGESGSTHVAVCDDCTCCFSQFLRVLEIAY